MSKKRSSVEEVSESTKDYIDNQVLSYSDKGLTFVLAAAEKGLAEQLEILTNVKQNIADFNYAIAKVSEEIKVREDSPKTQEDINPN